MRINQCLVEADGFDLIAMGQPEGPGCYCAANHLVARFMEVLGKNYPYVLMDNEAGMEHMSRLTTNKVEAVHVSRLLPFNYDATRTSPPDAAHAARQEFTIETILNHRGDKKTRSTLEFEVKWLGYSDAYNSWEPWSNLRETDALHTYLRTHGMASLIPTRFRT
jgi:hypothetical protein